MVHKVIADFRDKNDDLYLYKVGDEFPRKGKRPAQARKDELVNKGFLKEVEQWQLLTV